ncbi:MAG: hypothetical protein AABY22_14115, partial [Nanoarchaeota archaeon]
MVFKKGQQSWNKNKKCIWVSNKLLKDNPMKDPIIAEKVASKNRGKHLWKDKPHPKGMLGKRNTWSVFIKGKHISKATEFVKGRKPWNQGQSIPKNKLKEMKKNGFGLRKGHNIGIETRFKKGSVPYNKGMKKPEEEKQKIVLKLKLKPSSFEKKLQEIINKNSLPYKYTGDGSFLIGYKNPDFINVNGKKIAIEVYSTHFKIRSFGSEENYQKQRTKIFAKYGWKCIFINERNLL